MTGRSFDCEVRVWRTGRFWRPWETAVYSGPGVFGEAGCDWSAWTRQRAIRKGLRIIAGHADFQLESQTRLLVQVSEVQRNGVERG